MRLLAATLLIALLAGCDAVVEPEPERSFTTSIERIAGSEHEFQLLAVAENYYPPRDSLLTWVIPEHHHLIPEDKYWWWAWSTWYGGEVIYVPWTITVDAVDYYSVMIDRMENETIFEPVTTAALSYRTEIRFEAAYTFEGVDPWTNEPLPSQSFEEVYVVEMDLKWSLHCGSLCGMWVNHNRIVVLSEGGAVVGSFFDGPRPIAVP